MSLSIEKDIICQQHFEKLAFNFFVYCLFCKRLFS